MTYQGSGQRRIKNPRIWSLHDLVLLGERGARPTEAERTVDPAPARPARPRASDADGLVFRVPMTGRVYLRPSPEKPLFVAVGDVIARGTTVCVVEAMKSFNRVSYGGESLPERARVVRFAIEDGSDVDEDMPLIELEEV
jgi:acetyl-CoA carboxylase biotin carboxyl carrier protein